MKRRPIPIASLVVFLAAGPITRAQTNSIPEAPAAPPATTPATNDVVRLDFASFQVIAEHNIFDPNRRQRSTRREPPQRQVQVDYFTLNGISMVNHQQTAFFTGSSSLLGGRFTVKDTIGGYKIMEIDPGMDYVKLAAASNSVIKLELLDQMRRSDKGPWALVRNAPSEPEPKPAVAAGETTTSSSATPSTGGAEDDIVKKLMQKRLKETAK